MRFEVHSFYIHNRETPTPIHTPPHTHTPAWPPSPSLSPFPTRPESAPFCTVSGAPSPTVFRATFLPGLSDSPHSSHSLGECRTFARYRYTLPMTFPTMCPYRAYSLITPLLPGRRVHRSARFRRHSPLRFFVQPSFQASQATLNNYHDAF